MVCVLQVHKSGGTTLGNMFARYTVNHDLDVALPNKDPSSPGRFNYFSRPFTPNTVMPVAMGQHYHVIFDYLIYNRTTLDTVMAPDAFYSTMIRRPEARLLSAFNYFDHLLPLALREYLNHARSLLSSANQSNFRGREINLNVVKELVGESTATTNMETKNVSLEKLLTSDEMSWLRMPEVYNSFATSSGLPLHLQNDSTAIENHVKKLDREMDLVMLVERFDESLVLLKRRACLSLRDILYLQQKVRKRSYRYIFSRSDVQFERLWQQADHALYDHFSAKFSTEVIREGPGFPDEVSTLGSTPHFAIQS